MGVVGVEQNSEIFNTDPTATRPRSVAPDLVEHAIMAAATALLLPLLNYLNESFSKKELSSHALLFFQDRDN